MSAKKDRTELLKFVKANAKKMKQKDIAKKFGITPRNLYRILKKNGISFLKMSKGAQKKNALQGQGTLCWNCGKATNIDGKCSWSRELKPVDGWEASEKYYKSNGGHRKTYFVKNCPLFVKG